MPHAPSPTPTPGARRHAAAHRTIRAALLLAAGAALMLPVACASKPRQPGGEVLRIDEITRREREGYDLARQAAAAQAKGNDEQAIELYRRAVAAWPEIPSAWNNMGLLLMDQNNFMDAVDAFKTAARQDPSDPRPLINVGVAYDRTGWAEESLTAYTQALERRPNDRDALMGAILANHRLLAANRAALQRVRTALMVEPDPDVRTWLERERFRIESRLQVTAEEDAISIPPPSRAAAPTPGAPAPAIVVPAGPN